MSDFKEGATLQIVSVNSAQRGDKLTQRGFQLLIELRDVTEWLKDIAVLAEKVEQLEAFVVTRNKEAKKWFRNTSTSKSQS